MKHRQYIRLSVLNDMTHDTLNARFERQQFWVLADITNHSYKADKRSIILSWWRKRRTAMP